ncbi:flagellar basal body rod protein FlgC [bacterium]|nr:flagellar basal body rod protein FlgC [bacterium]MBU1983892.1 flagellar basal body rod protein FlgC [bacterium]
MKIDRLFTAMDVSASGLAVQRKRMNVIAENLANAETTRTAEGGPYRRQKVVLGQDRQFALELDAQTRVTNDLRREHVNHLPAKESTPDDSQFSGVKADVVADPSPFREVYDPGHPDADENGMVKLPNVDLVEEMTELIAASRAYEANVTAFNASKSMMKKALDL